MFTLDPAAAEQCDVVVVVPKMDERVGLERSWGIDLQRAHGKLGSGKKYWGVRMGDLSLVVAFLNEQGPAAARGIAEQLVHHFNPRLLFLLGTAAGREGKTRIGDVIVSTLVVDLTEQRAGKKGVTFRAKHYRPQALLEDATEFLAKGFDTAQFASDVEAEVEGLPSELSALCRRGGRAPRAQAEILASGATLYVGKMLARVWENDDRYRAVDMESGGFASALESSEAQWLVIRGISDFGTEESKQEEFRPLAAAAAASFLAAFLRDGLDEARPRALSRAASLRATPDQAVSLFKSLRRYWRLEDLTDGQQVADECASAAGSGQWALVREAERVRAIGSSRSEPPTLADYLGARRRLQVALDMRDIDAAGSLARSVADAGADFVEVGDPLIKQHGLAAISRIHEAVPEALVVAEMSTSDWCGSQVEMAAAAGADVVLLLGCWRQASVIEGATAAARLHVPLMIEVPQALASESWVRELEHAGVQGLAVIGNLDSRNEGVASIDRVRRLREITDLPIAVSGGLTESDFPALDEVPWDILIVGRAILDSESPTGATKSLAHHVGERFARPD